MPTLNWIGKEAVEKHHLEIPYRLIEYDDELSAGDKEAGNLLIQGDNLHALKALLPYYAGKVKCIYIDPPYNTGNENWQYNDNVKAPEIKKWLNDVVGKEGEDLTRHDKWLCMMYPRLQLLKKLLSKNGAIFVSIDDNEQGNLRLLLDEIFGRKSFLGNIIWQHSIQGKNDVKGISLHHNHILVYSKSNFVIKPLDRTEEHNKAYKNPDNDINGLWRSGDVRSPNLRENLKFNINTPSGNIILPPAKGWRWSEELLNQKINSGEIIFNSDETKIIRKIYLSKQKGRVVESIWHGKDVGTTREANSKLKEIFNQSIPFDTPKPVELVERIIKISSDKNDLILDSFSGSGTTGQAVLELNKIDGGKRKFILVELEEDIAKNVTAERLKRVINGYEVEKQNGTKIQIEALGGGFQYCKLSEPLFDQYGNVRDGVTFKQLAYHVFFSETGTPLKGNTKLDTPLIGKHKGVAYYLLFNGILGDKTINGGNVLTSKTLEALPKYKGNKIIFGMASRLGTSRLKKENIIFKQIPVEIKTS